MGIKRGVGYCLNQECQMGSRGKGCFLLNYDSRFYCTECKILGFVEPERGFASGEGSIFREVRIEYNFNPHTRTYHSLALVWDEALPRDYNSYTVFSPLVQTEKRALSVAERILANLNRYVSNIDYGSGAISSSEMILSFDKDRNDFLQSVKRIEKFWKNSA